MRKYEDEDLTGRQRLRATWRGRLVLQVEYRIPGHSIGTWRTMWRDARAQDLTGQDMYQAVEDPEQGVHYE